MRNPRFASQKLFVPPDRGEFFMLPLSEILMSPLFLTSLEYRSLNIRDSQGFSDSSLDRQPTGRLPTQEDVNAFYTAFAAQTLQQDFPLKVLSQHW